MTLRTVRNARNGEAEVAAGSNTHEKNHQVLPHFFSCAAMISRAFVRVRDAAHVGMAAPAMKFSLLSRRQ